MYVCVCVCSNKPSPAAIIGKSNGQESHLNSRTCESCYSEFLIHFPRPTLRLTIRPSYVPSHILHTLTHFPFHTHSTPFPILITCLLPQSPHLPHFIRAPLTCLHKHTFAFCTPLVLHTPQFLAFLNSPYRRSHSPALTPRSNTPLYTSTITSP